VYLYVEVSNAKAHEVRKEGISGEVGFCEGRQPLVRTVELVAYHLHLVPWFCIKKQQQQQKQQKTH